jgi:alkaline phosphatase D
MSQPTSHGASRRGVLRASAGAAALTLVGYSPWDTRAQQPADAAAPPVMQAMGAKAGEVTHDSAIIWTRLTAAPQRADGFVFPAKRGKAQQKVAHPPLDACDGACPGMAGRIRVAYSVDAGFANAALTDWVEVGPDSDYSHQFKLTGLRANTRYHYRVATEPLGGAGAHGTLIGTFETAPSPDAPSDLSFCMMTCQGYPDRGHPDGHPIYPSMLALRPKFVVYAGDNVYYDNDPPSADTIELARYHWQRMFSLPRIRQMLLSAGCYFTKDDHDTLANDAFPGARVGSLTYGKGQEIYRQQVPIDGPCFRTFRWGKDLQVWLTDGRDFRSPNKMPDGPEKSIWGREQKAWFKKTVKESDATWKLLLSPTPVVGPDRQGKNDNHANTGFKTEGDELRRWMQANVPENFFVLCGDRHWQYESVHPETGVREFSVGAASDEHAGGSPGFDPAYHKFHRVKGGFLQVAVERKAGVSVLAFRHRDVDGAIVHESKFERKV